MVYATGNNHSFVSKKPLNTKRVQSEASKEISEYMRTHKISVQTNSSGEVIVKAIKNDL